VALGVGRIGLAARAGEARPARADGFVGTSTTAWPSATGRRATWWPILLQPSAARTEPALAGGEPVGAAVAAGAGDLD
jgi:hypothetical protein